MAYVADDEILTCCLCRSIVRSPIQLACLHNCCSHCAINAEARDGTGRVTCGLCHNATEIKTAQENLFISGHLRSLNILKGCVKCDFCIADTKPDVTAQFWCHTCCKFFCDQCLPGHSKFNRNHETRTLEDLCCSSRAPTVSEHVCGLHGQAFDHLCWDCRTCKCLTCGKACIQAGHKLTICGPLTDEFVSKVKHHIGSLRDTLVQKSAILRNHRELFHNMNAARKESLALLQNNKKRVVDALEQVYESAKEDLNGIYDRLSSRAAELMRSADSLDKTVGYAVTYSGLLVECAGTTCLLQQYNILLMRMQSLLDELTHMPAPAVYSDVISVEHALPKDLDILLKTWIGLPKVEVCIDSSLPQDTSLQDPATQVHSPMNVVENASLCLGPSSGGFEVGYQCLDMAVTPDGCILLAAPDLGLLEFDSCGKKLACWVPVGQELEGRHEDGVGITTVAIVDNVVVAVGLSSADCVVLLSRSPASSDNRWLENRRICGLQCNFTSQLPPWRIAACGDVLAIASCASSGASLPGPKLTIAALTDDQVMLRLNLDYDILSLTATKQCVITSSDGRVKSNSETNSYVVDGYCHSGLRLWRIELGARVCGSCATPWGPDVCLALPAANKVMAISSEDGTHLATVLRCSSKGLKNPARVSVSQEDPAFFVSLAADLRTVTIYHVAAAIK